MQKSNAPTKLTVAFASGTGAGPVNTVPLTPGATPGTASYQTGFTSVNMEPIASGGIPPFGADFNGLFQAQTTAQIWQQSGYMWPFDSTFASNANINGYPAGSVLAMGSGKGFWINQTDNNTTNPDATGSSGWIGLPAGGTNTINTTGGTVVANPSVLGVTTLYVSGALTSNATVVLPLTAGAHWIIRNFTTGNFSVTVQGSSGIGVSIPQQSSYLVFTEGVNYYAISSPMSGAYLPIDGTAVAATKLATARTFSITGFATAAGISFDGTGNVTFNVTALNVAGALGYTPANDASVVHIAGAETITGAKTFSNQIVNSASGSNTNPANMAFVGTGSFGGGMGFKSGAYGAAVFLTAGSGGGVLNFATGSNTSIASDATLDWLGNFSTTGGITANTGTFSGTLTCATMNATSSDRRLKRNIRKVDPRPLHRNVKFVSYTMKDSGWCGLGSIAQNAKRYAPEHVGTFDKDGKTYYSLNYAGMAYEQAMWAGQEVDRLTKRIAKLERALERAKIEPRKRGFVRRLLEAIW